MSFAALAAAAFATMSVLRHDRFGSNAYDLGIFDQTIWGYSELSLIPNTVRGVPYLLADHFHPILVSLAPLYWLWDDARMLLIAQAVLLALASLPLFLWARRELGVVPALLFQVAYLCFWGLIAGNLFDFHELSFAPAIVSVALYAVLTKRNRLFLAMVPLAFVTKENLALTFAAIGLYIALVQRRWRLGLPVAAVSVGWFLVLIKAILPALSGRSYGYWTYSALGSGPGSALVNLFAHPVESARLFFSPRVKQVALFDLFAPWLALPLLSPLLLVALPTLGERFFSENPNHWARGFHYSLVLSPILAFAAVDTTARMRRVLGDRITRLFPALLAGAVLAAGLWFTIGRVRPLDEFDVYPNARQIAEIRSCLRTIPPRASVTAMHSLLPHLTHRRHAYPLDERPVRPTQYIALTASHWSFPLIRQRLRSQVLQAFGRGYGVGCAGEGTLVLLQGAQERRIPDRLRRKLRLPA